MLLLATSFTKIIVVLGLTRNALGLPSSPPNQVLTGIALFLTLFVMGPVFSDINDVAVQPYMDGTMTVSQAYDSGVVPLREFLLGNTREDELKLMIGLSGEEAPADDQPGQHDHAHPGVRALGAQERVHHRAGRLHPVPGAGHAGQRLAHGDGHDDGAADDRVAAVQAAALRRRRRLGADHHSPRRLVRGVEP